MISTSHKVAGQLSFSAFPWTSGTWAQILFLCLQWHFHAHAVKRKIVRGGPGPAAPNPSMSLYRITRECETCALCWSMCLWPSLPQWCLLVIEPFAWQWYLMWSEHGRKVELFHLRGGKHPLWDWGQITSSANDWMASFSVGHKCPWTGRPCELMALWLYGHNVYRSQKHCWMGSSFASWWLVTV